MRCEEAGYSHILVDDAFVFHKGHVSMLLAGDIDESSLSLDSHEKIPQDRYPNYLETVSDFIESGVMERISGNIIQNITSFMAKNRKKILYVIHEPINGQKIGGTEFHVRDLTNGLSKTYAIYVTYIIKGRHFIVEEYVDGLKSSYLFDIPFKLDRFTLTNFYLFKVYSEILNTFEIDVLHIHHLINQTLDIIYAAKSLGIPVIMTIHDYYLLSPDYNLLYRLTENGYSSNRLPTKKYFENKFQLIDFDNKEWQQLIAKYLTAVQLFIFPSIAAKNEFVNIYPVAEKKYKILEHGVRQHIVKKPIDGYVPASKKLFSVLFLGYVNDSHKGAYFLDKVIDRLLKNNIEVHILGSGCEYWQKYINNSLFHCHGNYLREDVVSILQYIKPSLVVLASPWPETYSYTYTEALQAQIPVVSFGIGAYKERAERHGATILVPEITADALIKTILSLSKRNKNYSVIKKQAKSVKFKTIEANIKEYKDLYCKIIQNNREGNLIHKTNKSVKNAFTLFALMKESTKLQNFAQVKQQELVQKISILETDNENLRLFNHKVKTSLYYKVYKKLNKYRLYYLTRSLKRVFYK